MTITVELEVTSDPRDRPSKVAGQVQSLLCGLFIEYPEILNHVNEVIPFQIVDARVTNYEA